MQKMQKKRKKCKKNVKTQEKCKKCKKHKKVKKSRNFLEKKFQTLFLNANIFKKENTQKMEFGQHYSTCS